ncbi:MAG TPA: hypothetical protein DHW14_08105 [Clostridiales bacterium]|nr:hypothetical protein [Clostridiales bacterium]
MCGACFEDAGDRLGDGPEVEMSVPAEAEEEPFEVLAQHQLSSDQAHIMPQLFGWMTPAEQRERARFLSDLTRPRRIRRHPPLTGSSGAEPVGSPSVAGAEHPGIPTTEA